MFSNAIYATPLTSSFANECFSNIRGDPWLDGDNSFVATLRALLANRIPAEDRVSVRVTSSSYSERDIRNTSKSGLLSSIMPNFRIVKGRITIHNFCASNDSDNAANFENVLNNFVHVYSGWIRIEKVTVFFKKSFKVLCFVNEETKNVAVFVEKLNLKKLHYLQCAIFAFLPWYFDPKVGVEKDEMELIESLRERESTHYEECLAKIAQKFDLRERSIRKLLGDFETKYERSEISRVERDLQNTRSRINEANDNIRSYLNEMDELNIKLLGLTTKVKSSEDSELMEYFICNKNIRLDSVDDDSMTFVCADYLEYYDEDMARRMIDNPRSYVYRLDSESMDSYIPAEDMKKLMCAIFIDGDLKVRMCSAYTLELRGRVTARDGFRYDPDFNTYTPNTHIDRYRCMGNYEYTINERLRERDYIGAIEQCMASCKSLNFADSPVMSEFMRRIYGTSDYSVNIRCIELPDGRVVEPKEAIEWIHAQEAEEKKEE